MIVVVTAASERASERMMSTQQTLKEGNGADIVVVFRTVLRFLSRIAVVAKVVQWKVRSSLPRGDGLC